MTIWGLIIGGATGFAFGGPIGALLGAAAGTLSGTAAAPAYRPRAEQKGCLHSRCNRSVCKNGTR